MMNTERILALADIIEKQPLSNYYAPSGFGMGSWVHNCGTPSCIAGWAHATFPTLDCGSHFDRGRVALGLSDDQADLLFQPHDMGEVDQFDEISPQRAATVLRSFAATGKVDWSTASPTGEAE